MRDFRDAKAMAHTLRDSLTTKAITISHGESLELVSKMLGVADWNTLAALLQAERREGGTQGNRSGAVARTYAAVPLRDFVPFPTATFPLFVGREKSMLALKHAFERQREVVLAVQRNSGVDEPGADDVYDIGVLAHLVEIRPLPDRTLQVIVQAHRRVVIRLFRNDSGTFQADINDIDEGPIPDTPFLIKRAATRFESYSAVRGIPKTWPALDRIRDPGRLADIIAAQLALPISDKQGLLSTLDPVTRLERVGAFMDVSVLPLSEHLDVTRRRAVDLASRRRNAHSTLEHLTLALIDDVDASALIRACNANPAALRADLLGYLDNGLKDAVLPNDAIASPTAAFERVLQSAALHARELGHSAVTGANVLMAIFPESLSPAARLLHQHGVTRELVTKFIAGDAPLTGRRG